MSKSLNSEIVTFQSSKNAEIAQQNNIDPFETMLRTSGELNPEAILKKSIYDKVAATIILDKFLKFYNSDA